jgi:hypothetical protein
VGAEFRNGELHAAYTEPWSDELDHAVRALLKSSP